MKKIAENSLTVSAVHEAYRLFLEKKNLSFFLLPFGRSLVKKLLVLHCISYRIFFFLLTVEIIFIGNEKECVPLFSWKNLHHGGDGCPYDGVRGRGYCDGGCPIVRGVVIIIVVVVKEVLVVVYVMVVVFYPVVVFMYPYGPKMPRVWSTRQIYIIK